MFRTAALLRGLFRESGDFLDEQFRQLFERNPVKLTGGKFQIAVAGLLIGAFPLAASAQDRNDEVLNGAVRLLAGPREEAQPATAQTVGGLSEKVEVGETIFVTDRNGVQAGGRLLRLSPEALTLLIRGREQVMPLNRIGRVERRDSLWNGMLVGAVPSALLGMAAAGASCSPSCGRDVPLVALGVGAVGAGIGALIDFSIHGYSIIDGQSLASPNARRVTAPVASVDDLWLRVRQGDTIAVATIGGQKVTGKFVQVAQTSVTLNVNGDDRVIPSSEIRLITRAGNRYRSGALLGGTIVGALGLIASASCSGGSSSCGNPLFVGMFMGSAGSLWGAAIGAAIPKYPVVYTSNGSSGVRVMPLMHSGRVGVAFSARF